jgi:hypothetical protein
MVTNDNQVSVLRAVTIYVNSRHRNANRIQVIDGTFQA